MRNVRTQQLELGAVGIEDIDLDTRSRDDIPALLLGCSISMPMRRSGPGCSRSWTSTFFPVWTGRSEDRAWRCGRSW